MGNKCPHGGSEKDTMEEESLSVVVPLNFEIWRRMCGSLWLSSLKQIANSSRPMPQALNNDVFGKALRRYLSNAQAVFRQDLIKEEKEQK